MLRVWKRECSGEKLERRKIILVESRRQSEGGRRMDQKQKKAN
jgi:hypothetical protein